MCFPVLYTVTPLEDVNIHITSAEVSAVIISADIKVYYRTAVIDKSACITGDAVAVIPLSVRGNDVHFRSVGYLSRVYSHTSRHSGCACGADVL